MGGEHQPLAHLNEVGGGSSPRGRGTLFTAPLTEIRARVIPAWAGNTRGNPLRTLSVPGHPRVGGEHMHRDALVVGAHGSSPRGRGTPTPTWRCGLAPRVIPAWAGNTRPRWTRWPAGTGHPRVGGEHDADADALADGYGSSPRGRGTQRQNPEGRQRGRVIPAWAGNTEQRVAAAGGEQGHPRVGGEHTRRCPQR